MTARGSFRQRDLTRAIKAMVASGLGVARAEVDKDGKIVVIPVRPDAGSDETPENLKDLI
jgi:hypothetical protein